MPRQEIKHQYPLRDLNSFGLDVSADTYFRLSRPDAVGTAVDLLQRSRQQLILGGGSNLLFVEDFPGTVVHVTIPGRTIEGRDSTHIYLKLGAGENWHETVLFCVANGWGGIENLALIPGTVGAAPIQNIGAYGSEIADVFHELEAVDLADGRTKVMSRQDCHFGYRDSIFKRPGNNHYLILSVTVKLALQPKVTISHLQIRDRLADNRLDTPSIADICATVMEVRRQKLPDPALLGNGGSFFKNPEISVEQYHELHDRYPDLPGYRLSDSRIKIPAGWLIEQAGWKEKTRGQKCGVHENQALVLVNRGGATGSEILELARAIAGSIGKTFGISLEYEVRVIS